MRYKNLCGKRFGRLFVREYFGNNKHRCALFVCDCDCGKTTIVRGTALSRGTTQSCGCFQHDVSREVMKKVNESGKRKVNPQQTHGGSHTKLYSIWCGMKKRCYNPKHEHYDRYGGRGIAVCDEWLHDYPAFRDWALANGYSDDLSIDRKDNDKGYCPDNCHWTTQKEQVKNRRNTITLKIGRTEKPLIEWCNVFGVPYKLAHERYRKGFPIDKVFEISLDMDVCMQGNGDYGA